VTHTVKTAKIIGDVMMGNITFLGFFAVFYV